MTAAQMRHSPSERLCFLEAPGGIEIAFLYGQKRVKGA